jgi:hypothetical protein
LSYNYINKLDTRITIEKTTIISDVITSTFFKNIKNIRR